MMECVNNDIFIKFLETLFWLNFELFLTTFILIFEVISYSFNFLVTSYYFLVNFVQISFTIIFYLIIFLIFKFF